jgi:thioredoxin 1
LQIKKDMPFIGILIVLGITLILFINCGDQAENKSNPGLSQTEGKAQPAIKMPMLVDLGKGTCIPCKKMKPILDTLKAEYQGKAIVRIIDLRDEPKEASKYGIRLIPTQIFFDAEGKEIYRHEGFLDKQTIKAKFAEMGVY